MFFSPPQVIVTRLAAILFTLLCSLLFVQTSRVEAGVNDIAVQAPCSTGVVAGGGGNQLIFSHTVNAGSNLMLIVGVAFSSSTVSVTGISFGAQTFTGPNGGLLGSQPSPTAQKTEMWYLRAPNVTTANITINFSGGVRSSGGACTFSGVDQTIANWSGSWRSSSGTDAAPTTPNVPSAAREAVIDACAASTPISNITISTGATQTKQWNAAAGNFVYGMGSTAPGAAPNVTMSWSISGPRNWGCGAVSMKPAVAPTAVDLHSFTARQNAAGQVLLHWRTGHEVDNLGFHVYREEGGRRLQLTPEPVAGSALLSKATLTAGRRYAWLDTPSGPNSAVRYWLEDIDLNGTRTWHGPVVPEYTREPLGEQKASAFLSTLGRGTQDGYRAYQKARELRGRLNKRPVEDYAARVHSGEMDKNDVLRETILQDGTSAKNTLSAPQSASGSGRDRQTKIAGLPAVKIYVKAEGWYRVGQPELAAAGLDPRVDPRGLRLYAEGQEQAIVVTGEQDGRFDSADAVEFYGTGQDTPCADTRVYWLSAEMGRGARLGSGWVSSTRRGSAVSASFVATAVLRERTIYFSALLNGEAENFFGSVVSPAAAVDQVLEVPAPDASAREEALLEVSLQGVSAGEHRVAVSLNMVRVGEVVFSGRASGEGRFALPHGGLRDGENLVTLEALGEGDVSLVDAIRLGYRRLYRAEGGSLRCTAPGGARLEIGGFAGPGVRVMDVTDPSRVLALEGRVWRAGAEYVYQGAVPGRGERQLLAFSADAVRAPQRRVQNRPSTWSRERVGADVLLISHRKYLGSLEPLARLRQSQGLTVARVDVEDLYDEYSFGSKSPWAIRDFLKGAYDSWGTRPQYVLFVGDASFDPRNYLGLGDYDLLPTKVVDTAYLETASDDWYADFDDDGVPEMAVGRLPVRTVHEAEGIVAKIVARDGISPNGVALLAADENDIFDFEAACRQVGDLLPSGMEQVEIYRGSMGTAAARAELLSGLGRGPSLAAYFGHGTIEGWRDELLTGADAASLTGEPAALFVAMTCLNGMFHDLYSEQSLAEALLLNPGGGATAVWASSGLTEPAPQLRMAEELMRLLYGGEALTLGEAVRRAKEATSDPDVRRTWILFGDPAMGLRLQ